MGDIWWLLSRQHFWCRHETSGSCLMWLAGFIKLIDIDCWISCWQRQSAILLHIFWNFCWIQAISLAYGTPPSHSICYIIWIYSNLINEFFYNIVKTQWYLRKSVATKSITFSRPQLFAICNANHLAKETYPYPGVQKQMTYWTNFDWG